MILSEFFKKTIKKSVLKENFKLTLCWHLSLVTASSNIYEKFVKRQSEMKKLGKAEEVR